MSNKTEIVEIVESKKEFIINTAHYKNNDKQLQSITFYNKRINEVDFLIDSMNTFFKVNEFQDLDLSLVDVNNNITEIERLFETETLTLENCYTNDLKMFLFALIIKEDLTDIKLLKIKVERKQLTKENQALKEILLSETDLTEDELNEKLNTKL